jgi:hypothetical protein
MSMDSPFGRVAASTGRVFNVLWWCASGHASTAACMRVGSITPGACCAIRRLPNVDSASPFELSVEHKASPAPEHSKARPSKRPTTTEALKSALSSHEIFGAT